MFTDDDLKRLKKHVKDKCVYGDFRPHNITALIARLEAAENCIYHLINPRSAKSKTCSCLNDWKKEAGR